MSNSTSCSDKGNLFEFDTTKKYCLDFKRINEVALNNVTSVLNRFASGGRMLGCEYVLKNPTRTDKKPGSFSINTGTAVWKDFATNDSGVGLIAFVAYVQQLTSKEAAQQLSDYLGLSPQGKLKKMNTTNTMSTTDCTELEASTTPPEQATSEDYEEYVIPDDAPHNKPHGLGTPSAWWSYKNRAGKRVQYILRFELKGGDKTFRPLIYTANGWEWKTIPKNRPLYNLDKLTAETSNIVVLVEGEKAAEAASLLFPDCVVTTSIGGAEAACKTDFSSLSGRSILLWQDNDIAGEKYINVITELLYKAKVSSMQHINLDCFKKYSLIPRENQQLILTDTPRDLPPKWDAADAVADGYTSDHLKELLEKPGFLVGVPKISKGDNKKEKGKDSREYRRAYNEYTVIKGNGDGGGGWGYTYTCDKAKGVVYHKVTVSEGKHSVNSTPVCSFLEVVARVRSAGEKDWGRILKIYTINGVCHLWNISTDLLSGDGAELRKGLLKLGLDIKTGKYINNYLTQYISEAARDLPLETCTNHLGWYDTSFILPDQVISANSQQQKIWYQSNFSIVNCYTQQGTLAEWQENVSKFCVGNTRLVLAVSVMLAAPLLHLLGGSSIGFHLVGKSSIGKTKILKVAASVCGDRKYLRQWRCTDNALEGIAYFHNDSTLVLDELSQANAEDFYKILYMLANGSGKSRANCAGLPKEVFNWQLLWLSSGEVGLTGLLAESKKRVKVGQQIRQIDIPAQADENFGVFENLHGVTSSARLADLLDENSSKFYGVTFVEWLKVLVKAVGINIVEATEQDRCFLTLEKIKQLYKQHQNNLLQPYPNATGQTVRVARGFALVATAGELATTAGITGWPEGTAYNAIEKIFKEYMQDRNSSSTQEETNILSHVKFFFEDNWRSLFVWLDKDGGISEEKITYNTAGYYRKSEKGYFFFMSCQQYEKHLCTGYEKKIVTETLVKSGWLVAGKDGKSSKLLRFSHLTRPKRFYVFNGDMMLTTDLEQKHEGSLSSQIECLEYV